MPTTFTCVAATFDRDLSAGEDTSGQPDGALLATGGTEVEWTEGRPKRVRNQRVWIALWPDEAAARGYVETMHDTIPLIRDATDAAHFIAQPYRTHGEVNWSPNGDPNGIYTALAERPRNGPIAVVTSLGFTKNPDGYAEFGAGTRDVRRAFADLPDCLLDVNMLPDLPMLDGPTITVWASETAIMKAAYRNDPHKSAMDVKAAPAIARGSFTRMRVLDLGGRWIGRPIAA
ncbi:MAG: hypothetical protein HRU32_10145 [Rhodobacteraceae bacterium]|nr:hypothetical protein [Paracoccaceae bacterium]